MPWPSRAWYRAICRAMLPCGKGRYTMAQENTNPHRKIVMDAIRTFAQSQGMYGRLLAALNEADEETRNGWLDQYKDCKDTLDFVFAFECG